MRFSFADLEAASCGLGPDDLTRLTPEQRARLETAEARRVADRWPAPPDWLVPRAVVRLPRLDRWARGIGWNGGFRAEGSLYVVERVRRTNQCRSGWAIRVQRLEAPFYRNGKEVCASFAVLARLPAGFVLSDEARDAARLMPEPRVRVRLDA